MKSIVIIERSENAPPEDKINARLSELPPGTKVTSAVTETNVTAVWGPSAGRGGYPEGSARQVLYTTTVVVEVPW